MILPKSNVEISILRKMKAVHFPMKSSDGPRVGDLRNRADLTDQQRIQLSAFAFKYRRQLALDIYEWEYVQEKLKLAEIEVAEKDSYDVRGNDFEVPTGAR